jgi:hypothetical protein
MLVPAVEEHIKILKQKFCDYFDTDVERLDWVRNQFAIITPFLRFKAEEELTDLKADRTLNFKFSVLSLDSFWIAVREEYPIVAERAIKILLSFSTTYMCELGFSKLTAIKTAKRERLRSVDAEMRVALSSVSPRINIICSTKQAQVSH